MVCPHTLGTKQYQLRRTERTSCTARTPLFRGKNEMRKKHVYPAQRKARNVEYSKSYKILHAVGEEKLKEIFSKVGMYLASERITLILGYYVSPYVTRHCRDRYNLGGSDEKVI